ncbi:MAG: hypothetical protein JNM90_10280 [Burkholderiales bacterium]|nr:hypothetical protein [Burkholderiales bacterium]
MIRPAVRRHLALLLAATALAGAATAHAADSPDEAMRAARARWAASKHGPMLERLIPPYLEPSGLPEPRSAGARLTARYCVQCHNLASPAMHHAEKWPAIVQRMLPRMEGRGNMGGLMHDLMAGVSAPTVEETATLVAYLQKHAQKKVDPADLPEAGRTRAWESYTQACAQCHALPDPRRHTRAAWPAVVARMERNMQWMNRVVGSRHEPREPQYRADEIVAYLQRHARR